MLRRRCLKVGEVTSGARAVSAGDVARERGNDSRELLTVARERVRVRIREIVRCARDGRAFFFDQEKRLVERGSRIRAADLTVDPSIADGERGGSERQHLLRVLLETRVLRDARRKTEQSADS